MFTMRQKIFISSGIVVGLLLILFLVLFYVKSNNNQTNNDTPITTIDQNVIDVNNLNLILNNNNQNIVKPEGTPEELSVKQTARSFVERFFTYSNQNNNVHISELSDIVTGSMNTWMKSQAQNADTVYSGMTTNVVSFKLTNFDKALGVASVIVEANQVLSKEVDNTLEKSTEQKTFQVDFKLVNSEWKVDGVWDMNS